jgi:signal transduction histidine kinase
LCCEAQPRERKSPRARGASPLTSALATAGTEARAHPIVIAIGAVASGCAVLGALAIETGQLRDHSSAYAALTILAGVSFVVAGLTAWARRSERWTGALMVGAGFALFAGALAEANHSLPFTVGLATTLIPNAVLAHLVLAFPDGRLHSTLERLLVGGAYLSAAGLQIAMLMFMNISNVGGCPCPSNLLFVRDEMGLHATLMNAERYAGIALAAGIAVVLIRRWEAASRLLRRALAPILVTGGVTTALLGAMFIAEQASSRVSTDLEYTARLALATVPLAYLFGLFGARLARADVSNLVVELGRAPEPGRLRDALSRALRDPTLELGYRLPESDGYADVDGRPVDVTPAATRAVTILERRGRKVAALVHDAGLSEDPALLDAVSSAAGLALENERLLAELRAQLEEIRDSRARIVDAAQTERRRLERDLHDGAQQRLVTLSLHLRLAQESLRDDPSATEQMLSDVGDDLKRALEELRDLARGLHPAILTDRGLTPALQSLASRAPFPVEICSVATKRPSEAIEAALYFVVAESLTNAAKHADASGARVALSTTNGAVVVEISDNGSGGATLANGSGIRGLADRVEALGGAFELESPRGTGTTVRARLPMR